MSAGDPRHVGGARGRDGGNMWPWTNPGSQHEARIQALEDTVRLLLRALLLPDLSDRKVLADRLTSMIPPPTASSPPPLASPTATSKRPSPARVRTAADVSVMSREHRLDLQRTRQEAQATLPPRPNVPAPVAPWDLVPAETRPSDLTLPDPRAQTPHPTSGEAAIPPPRPSDADPADHGSASAPAQIGPPAPTAMSSTAPGNNRAADSPAARPAGTDARRTIRTDGRLD